MITEWPWPLFEEKHVLDSKKCNAHGIYCIALWLHVLVVPLSAYVSGLAHDIVCAHFVPQTRRFACSWWSVS